MTRDDEIKLTREQFALMRMQEAVFDYSDVGRIGVGRSIRFNMLSVKPANDTDEFYTATARWNSGMWRT